ncbi:MAG: carbohydrate binding domain-containing protein [Firmicutes bacterium]|nr:carbohydrate binding domain-containing protein [Bacillota bacterium]
MMKLSGVITRKLLVIFVCMSFLICQLGFSITNTVASEGVKIRINNTYLTFNKVIYADSSIGNDSTGDGSKEKPFKTVQKADTIANSGDAVILKGWFNVNKYEFIRSGVSYIGYEKKTVLYGSDYWFVGAVSFYKMVFDHGYVDETWTLGGNANLYNIVIDHQYSSNGSREIFVYSTGKVENCLVTYGNWNSLYWGSMNITAKNNAIAQPCSWWPFALRGVSYDSDYRITSGGWKNTGVGTNPDGTQSHIGVYGGPFAWGYEPELLPNPSFDTGTDNWHCSANSNARVSGERDTSNYDTAPAGYRIQCITKGIGAESIQFFTMPLNIVQDKVYLFTFKAKSSSSFSIPSIQLMKAASPWTLYAAPYNGLTVTTGWQKYAVIFKANTTAADGRITFFLGGALPDGATFHIDTLSLTEIPLSPPPVNELLPNPSFDTGAGWNFYSDSTAQAKGYLDPSDFDTAPVSYRIECTQSGSSVNAIQLFTMPFNLTANKKYQLTFKAKCSSAFTIPSIRLMKSTSPWTIYAWPLGVVSITTEWQTYTVNFTANTTANDGRLTFFLGNALPPEAVFWIDSVSLRELAQ